MDGYCTESLPKTSETGAGLNYSKIFHSVLQYEYFSPALFLAKYIVEYEKSSLDKKKLTGFLAGDDFSEMSDALQMKHQEELLESVK